MTTSITFYKNIFDFDSQDRPRVLNFEDYKNWLAENASPLNLIINKLNTIGDLRQLTEVVRSEIELYNYNYALIETPTMSLFYWIIHVNKNTDDTYLLTMINDFTTNYTINLLNAQGDITRSHLDRFYFDFETARYNFNYEKDTRLLIKELGDNAKRIIKRYPVLTETEPAVLSAGLLVCYSNKTIGTMPTITLPNVQYGGTDSNFYYMYLDYFEPPAINYINRLINSKTYGGKIISISSIPKDFLILGDFFLTELEGQLKFIANAVKGFKKNEITNLDFVPSYIKNDFKQGDLIDINKEPKLYLSNFKSFSFGRTGYKKDEIGKALTKNKFYINYANFTGKDVYSIDVPLLEPVLYGNGQSLIIEQIDGSIPFAVTAEQQVFASNFNFEKQNLALPLQRSWEDYKMGAIRDAGNFGFDTINSLGGAGMNLATGNVGGAIKSLSSINPLKFLFNQGMNLKNQQINDGRMKEDYALNMENIEKSPNSIKSQVNYEILNQQLIAWNWYIEEKEPLTSILNNALSYFNKYGYLMAQNGRFGDYFNTRYRFNYLEIDITTSNSRSIPVVILGELKQAYQTGIRLWNYRDANLFDYNYENYERSLNLDETT